MSSTAFPPLFPTEIRRLSELEGSDMPALATGLSHLDALLPGGGVPLGALTELLDEGISSGARLSMDETGSLTFAGHLACQCLQQRQSQGRGGFVVWIDTRGDLYPPAVLSLGLPSSRFLLARPSNPSDALWAFDQAIRCRQVAAAVVTLTRLEMPHLRRLQLAARDGGALALLVRPGAEAKNPSPAAARLRVRPIPSIEGPDTRVNTQSHDIDAIHAAEAHPEPLLSVHAFSFAVELLRVRGGWATGGVRVDVRWNLEDPHGAAQNSLHCVSATLE